MCANAGVGIAERAVALHLLRRVREVVVAADHMGDLHGDVVHHHAEVVGGGPVRAHEDPVVELAMVEDHRAVQEILHHRLALGRHAQPQRVGLARGHVGVAAGAGIAEGLARGPAPPSAARPARRACSGSDTPAPRRGGARHGPGRSRTARSAGSRGVGSPSSQSSPSHFSASRTEARYSSVDRSRSVSSMRRMNTPRCRRAKAQLKSAVRAPPTWRCPVGLGAKRTRTGSAMTSHCTAVADRDPSAWWPATEPVGRGRAGRAAETAPAPGCAPRPARTGGGASAGGAASG